jgi:hypothetical protein
MDPKIKDLILLFTDAGLILQECRELKANLSLELQAIRDDRRAQHREFHELMGELRETLTKIRAQFRIEAQLLNLIRPDTGENECQRNESENRSNRCHTLNKLSRRTH